MVFSSLIFLFCYLVVVLGVYYLLPRKARNAFLLFANLIFYGWGEPVYILLMGVCTLVNYLCGLLLARAATRARARFWLVCSIVISLGLLGVFKYTGFFASLLKILPGFSAIAVPVIPLPVGISFYTFQSMSYTIDVYRGETAAQRNFITFAAYVSLFPQLIAGPIVRYRDVEEQLTGRVETLSGFAAGVRTFTVGLAKKVLIANVCGACWTALSAGQSGWAAAWVGILAYTLQIYFDFSGYSDMAVGLGRMFGFEFMENFRYPYLACSITEFWRRWHISLSTWFRDYLYIPLGGNRKGPLCQIRNLLIVWFLTGLWHGASLNFILWGLYYFLLLVLERFVLGKAWERVPGFVRLPVTFFLVMIGWTIFAFPDFSAMLSYFGALFSFGAPALCGDAGFLVLTYLPILLIGLLAATPLGKRAYDRVKATRWGRAGELLLVAAALILCTAALVSQSYNPFLYYQF